MICYYSTCVSICWVIDRKTKTSTNTSKKNIGDLLPGPSNKGMRYKDPERSTTLGVRYLDLQEDCVGILLSTETDLASYQFVFTTYPFDMSTVDKGFSGTVL